MLKTLLVYICAAIAEIGGCFTFWLWLREGRTGWWLIPGFLSLGLFAWLLTLVDSAAAGRAYAAYGGFYIGMSLAWLWTVENVKPDRSDIAGAMICIAGAALILFGRRV